MTGLQYWSELYTAVSTSFEALQQTGFDCQKYIYVADVVQKSDLMFHVM